MAAGGAQGVRSFTVADGVIGFDLFFQGHPRCIAAFAVVEPSGRFVLIETGPESTLEQLELGLRDAGLSPEGLEAILVTHIHLDHAGAAGALAARTGRPVYVHEAGLPHLASPERLWASATRVFGPAMGSLWKGITPVPRELLRPLGEHTALSFFGRSIDAYHTPGHASHHVVFALEGGVVFAGDAAGVRPPGVDYVRVPAMPPELDIEQWCRSVELVRSLRPSTLVLTHFGTLSGFLDAHLDAVARQLRTWGDAVLEGLQRGLEGEALARRLQALELEELRRAGLDEGAVAPFELITPVRLVAEGYRRYWVRLGPQHQGPAR